MHVCQPRTTSWPLYTAHAANQLQSVVLVSIEAVTEDVEVIKMSWSSMLAACNFLACPRSRPAGVEQYEQSSAAVKCSSQHICCSRLASWLRSLSTDPSGTAKCNTPATRGCDQYRASIPCRHWYCKGFDGSTARVYGVLDATAFEVCLTGSPRAGVYAVFAVRLPCLITQVWPFDADRVARS